MKIIILGPPAAGKGLQGELLAKKLGLPRLSTGALLRRIWQEGGKRGEEIGKYMSQGLNVPAVLLFEILTPWFIEHNEGFVVDNLSRNLEQLREFKKFLRKSGIKIDKVFHLNVSENEIVKRIARRRKENLKEGKVRPDEEPEVVKTRIKEGYKKEIAPILDFFRKMGVLIEINGGQSTKKVHEQILKNLELE